MLDPAVLYFSQKLDLVAVLLLDIDQIQLLDEEQYLCSLELACAL
jgi:hypothetical protein